MADLDYSIDALNAKGAFYGASAIFYVEGEDDIIFWTEILSHLPNFRFHVEATDGCPKLDEYIEEIVAGRLDAIAARDADYIRFKKKVPECARVIHTFGYSIENSLYIPGTIFWLCKAWCKDISLTQEECDVWTSAIASELKDLLVLDIANYVASAGVKVLDDNCTRFMLNQSSDRPCAKKIGKHRTDVEPQIPEAVVRNVRRKLGKDAAGIVATLRGHFWESAVLKYVVNVGRRLNKKVDVSYDGLYAAALSRLNPSHPHFSYYFKAVQDATATF